jgi:hypothetical protein
LGKASSPREEKRLPIVPAAQKAQVIPVAVDRFPSWAAWRNAAIVFCGSGVVFGRERQGVDAVEIAIGSVLDQVLDPVYRLGVC